MRAQQYLKRIKELDIVQYGFDTHARVLGIDKEEVKDLWNEATNNSFKRLPRTEFSMLERPEISTKFKPYWELQLPEGYEYLLFYLTPTAPILVPNHFITDKGSIPLLFQNFISNYDREMLMAFLVHDVECEMQRMTRFMTDGLLYEVGVEMGANWLKRNLIYTAVRAGNRYGKKDKLRRGFNVGKYNRDLIAATEYKYQISDEYRKHLHFLQKTDITRAKI